MIVQITMARNELALIKELLPIWSQHTDGFVFMLDRCNDGSFEYLNEVKETYNILEIITNTGEDGSLIIETNIRQRLFDTAYKYSNKIICLDSDEYLDGQMSKQQLEQFLDDNPDTVFHLQWKQYTSCNTLRVDGPWKNNFKDRIGCYSEACKFEEKQNHSTHLPMPKNQKALDPESLFIAHLQWLDKTHVAIKQYYWKVYDYVNNLVHNVQIVGNKAYDESVNDFKWEEEYTFDVLKIDPFIFEENAIYENYRLAYIKENTKKYNIPDLGDWGFDILNLDENKKCNSNRYKISVITAIGSNDIYSKYFQRYLDSVLDQHMFLQTEHIVVYSEWHAFFDNFEKYPNFKLIKEQEKLGVYNAWNIGIKNATTDYVTNWNVDDIRHPINTKIKYDAITKNDFDLIYNWYIPTQDASENFYNIQYENKSYLRYPDNYHNLVLENCYAGPDPLWKKSLHNKVGYFDYENFNTIGDWEMWIRFAKAGAKFKLIPEPLCIYLDHGDTVSKKQQDKVDQEKFRLSEKYYRKIKKVNLVLAVYKEDLSWLEKITNPEVDITLINKGIHEKHDKAKCITIKNIGVCDHSFSYYISNFYDDLYDYTIFSQGNPFDHYKNMIEFINNKEYEKGFIPLADLLIHIPPGEGTTIFVEGLLDYKFNGINFPAGAQYCVTKDRILAKPKKFWDDILNYLPWEEDHFTPYFMERTWFLLYDSNVDINKDYLNSPYFYKYKESNGK